MRPQLTCAPARRRGAGRALHGHLARRAARHGALEAARHHRRPRRDRGRHRRPARAGSNVLAGRAASVAGPVRPARRPPRRSCSAAPASGWTTIDRAHRRGAGGASASRFRPRRAGQRARCACSPTPPRRAIGRLNVYRRAAASWYGPGLYGGQLGCGGTLTPGTLGVAHKTLPCGTQRDPALPRPHASACRVVDRGPYVGGREFDLTAATAQRLRFGGVGSVLVAS